MSVGSGRARGEGADDVVGLVLGGADDRDAERAEHLADDRHLHLERIGHDLDVRPAGDDLGDAVGLVGGDEVDTPLRAPVVVPAGDEVRRAVGRHEPRDDVEEPAHRVDRRAVGRADGVGHAVERAEVQRGGVEQHEAVGHGVILSCGSDAADAAAPQRSA